MASSSQSVRVKAQAALADLEQKREHKNRFDLLNDV
jgi:hypothetical protein